MKRGLLWAALLAPACVLYPAPSATTLYACTTTADCGSGLTCATFADAGTYCQASLDAGAPDSGLGDAGDAGAEPWSTDGGFASVSILAISGGPVSTILPIDGGSTVGLDLVLGTSLWTVTGDTSGTGPSWSENATAALYQAAVLPVVLDGGTSTFRIEQIAAVSSAWYAAVYQETLPIPTALPHVIYESTNDGASWIPIGAFEGVLRMTAIEDPSQGPVLFAQTANDAGAPDTFYDSIVVFFSSPSGAASVSTPAGTDWNRVNAMVPFAPGGGVLIGRSVGDGELDVVALDAGGPVSYVFSTLSGVALPNDNLGPLLSTVGGGQPLVYLALATDGGGEGVWVSDGGAPQLLEEFPGTLGDSFAFALDPVSPRLWFADGVDLLTGNLQQLTLPAGSASVLALGAFGETMWGLSAFGLQNLTPTLSSAPPDPSIQEKFYGQSFSSFRALTGGLMALGGSDPNAPLIYAANGSAFGATPLTNLTYPGCTSLEPLDAQHVLMACDGGDFLTWPDAGPPGNQAGLVPINVGPGDLVVLPNDGGPITVFVSVGANLGVSAFSINPVDGGVLPVTVGSDVQGNVFATHFGSGPPAAYAYNTSNQLVRLASDGSDTPIGAVPGAFAVGTQGAVDPIDSSRFAVVQVPQGGPYTVQECQTDGGLSCQPLCTLPTLSLGYRFALSSGDLWLFSYLDDALADIPTTGAAHLFHVTAAAQQLAGQFAVAPACPEVSIGWAAGGLSPEGFDQLGIADQGSGQPPVLYLSGSRHTLVLNPQ